MSSIRNSKVIIGLSLVFFGISNLAEAKEKPRHWNERMKQLSQVLSELLPDVISTERFNSPKNFKKIEENTKKLASLTHGMPTKKETTSPAAGDSPDSDVSVPLIADLFKGEVQRAYEELKHGRRSYARSVLRTVPNFCIACHTRSSWGTDFSALKNEAPKALVSRLERAEYYAATRQFDRALDEYDAVIGDAQIAKTRQIEWERAVRHALAVSVRVKRDPDRAITLLDRALAVPTCPTFLKEDGALWRKSLVKWKDERSKEPKTAEGLLAEAKSLIAQATAQQKYPMDRSSDILYLRTSAVAHELLRVEPNGTHAGDGLFLLGVSYEALQDLDLWSLHEMYYKNCIQRFPKTPIARSCYGRYEQSIYAGYTGSSGMSLPDDVVEQLSKLKGLLE